MEINTANDSLLAGMSVTALLKRYPAAVSVFFQYRMACVGCAIADFHTVAQAAALYNIELAQFTTEMERASQNFSQEFFPATRENLQ